MYAVDGLETDFRGTSEEIFKISGVHATHGATHRGDRSNGPHGGRTNSLREARAVGNGATDRAEGATNLGRAGDSARAGGRGRGLGTGRGRHGDTLGLSTGASTARGDLIGVLGVLRLPDNIVDVVGIDRRGERDRHRATADHDGGIRGLRVLGGLLLDGTSMLDGIVLLGVDNLRQGLTTESGSHKLVEGVGGTGARALGLGRLLRAGALGTKTNLTLLLDDRLRDAVTGLVGNGGGDGRVLLVGRVSLLSGRSASGGDLLGEHALKSLGVLRVGTAERSGRDVGGRWGNATTSTGTGQTSNFTDLDGANTSVPEHAGDLLRGTDNAILRKVDLVEVLLVGGTAEKDSILAGVSSKPVLGAGTALPGGDLLGLLLNGLKVAKRGCARARHCYF